MSELDLSSLDTVARADAGAVLTLVHPITNENLGITIMLEGMDSATYRRATAAVANRRDKSSFRKLTLEQLREEGIATLAACTRGWQGVRVDGQDIPFTPSAANSLYSRFPWIREQVEAFISDRANYLSD